MCGRERERGRYNDKNREKIAEEMRKRRRERCGKERKTRDFASMDKEAGWQFSYACMREQDSKEEGEKEKREKKEDDSKLD